LGASNVHKGRIDIPSACGIAYVWVGQGCPFPRISSIIDN